MSEFNEIQQQASEVRKQYNALNTDLGYNTPDGMALVSFFLGDAGDVAKIVAAMENYRGSKGEGDTRAKLQHELGDCVLALCWLANHYSIDLEGAFNGTVDEIKARLSDGRE